jgi:hypothetical protein
MPVTNKILLANGCSHVAGSESSVSVVEYLGKLMNMPTLNIATPGGGNDRILRTTMDACLQNDVGFVLVGWSTHERMELVFNNTWELFGLGRVASTENVECRDRLQKLLDYMTLYCCDWDGPGIERTLTYQLSLQCFLETRGIDYLFFNAWNHLPEYYQSSKKSILNLDKYYKPQHGLYEEYQKIMPQHYSAMHHGNHTVHKLIAEELYEYAIKPRFQHCA